MSVKGVVRTSVLWGLKAIRTPVKAGQVIVLTYHSILEQDRFHRQMKLLKECGHTVLTIDEFVSWLGGATQLAAPGVLLTFDDCYLSQFENALPVLQRLNLPAVFFPVWKHLGSTSDWPHEYDFAGSFPLMDEKHLVALSDAGYAIGCHTNTHPSLTTITSDQAARELTDSRRGLEQLLKKPIKVLSYPYGNYNNSVIEVAKREGFEVAFTVERGLVLPGDDPYRLRRIPVLGEPVDREFDAYLSGVILAYWKLRAQLMR